MTVSTVYGRLIQCEGIEDKLRDCNLFRAFERSRVLTAATYFHTFLEEYLIGNCCRSSCLTEMHLE
jgi:hypothetical protein